jgi:2-polyprenyl-3-methyl-5-hydroxy-6-metoxy-1,4-benzoquinol methylase
MKKELLSWICCPYCQGGLDLFVASQQDGEIKEGELSCHCGKTYPIKRFIPRFVDSDLYVGSFSFEWQKHSRTQLDSANLNRRSEDALQNRTDCNLKDLKGKLVLDAGCGSGRYAEVAANSGATIVGFDLSYAIDASFKNIGRRVNVHLVQADMFNLPFKKEIFDFIYSFGVLHHTLDARKAFLRLPPLLKPQARISISVYSSYNKGIVYSSNLWRFFTTRMPRMLLYYLCFISVPLYYLYRLPVIGNIAKMVFPISMEPNWRWRLLDTFDWYSPKFQSKHTHAEVFGWFKEAGLSDAVVFKDEVAMSATKRS